MLKQMSDKCLLDGALEAVNVEKISTSRVLEFLVEIDSRRLWLGEGYSSLHDFCVRYLNYSEGEAGRRIQAARCTVKVEAIKPLLEKNEISLTGVSLIAPHITKENCDTLLPEVCHKSKKEIEEVLVRHFPEIKKDEFFKACLDEELKELLLEAHQEISEKNETIFLKRLLKHFLAPRRARRAHPSRHSRYVSKPLQRQIKAAAKYKCSFKSASGVECNQTAHLEIDHIRPWAKGGSSRDPHNLRVLCKAHNLRAASLEFPKKHLPEDARASALNPHRKAS